MVHGLLCTKDYVLSTDFRRSCKTEGILAGITGSEKRKKESSTWYTEHGYMGKHSEPARCTKYQIPCTALCGFSESELGLEISHEPADPRAADKIFKSLACDEHRVADLFLKGDRHGLARIDQGLYF